MERSGSPQAPPERSSRIERITNNIQEREHVSSLFYFAKFILHASVSFGLCGHLDYKFSTIEI